jgi:hypothetical protein
MVQSCSGDPADATVSSSGGAEASESRNLHGIVHQPPTENCEVKAGANEPKPPRFTPPDPENPTACRRANGLRNRRCRNPGAMTIRLSRHGRLTSRAGTLTL